MFDIPVAMKIRIFSTLLSAQVLAGILFTLPAASAQGGTWAKPTVAEATVEYFQPLIDWPKEQNKGQKEGRTLPVGPLK